MKEIEYHEFNLALQQLVEMRDPLFEVYHKITQPIIRVWDLNKIVIEPLINEFKRYDETKMKLLKEYGEEVEQNQYKIEAKNQPIFYKLFSELNQMKITVTLAVLSFEYFEKLVNEIDFNRLNLIKIIINIDETNS